MLRLLRLLHSVAAFSATYTHLLPTLTSAPVRLAPTSVSGRYRYVRWKWGRCVRAKSGAHCIGPIENYKRGKFIQEQDNDTLPKQATGCKHWEIPPSVRTLKPPTC